MPGQPSTPDGKTSPRRRSRNVILSAAAVAVLFAAVWLARRLDQSLRVATGLVSHTLCSETFICGLNPDQVYEEILRPMPALRRIRWAVRYHIDRGRREVRASAAGKFESRAVYRDRLGCIVVRGDEPPKLPLTEAVDQARAAAPLLPEIAGPALVEPLNDGLRAALDRAFAEPAQGPHRRVKAIVIAHNGRVVAERYAPGVDRAMPLIGYSVSKSVINAMVGILVRQGRLSVEQPSPVPAWREPSNPRTRLLWTVCSE